MFVQYDPLLYQLQIYTRGALRDLWKDRTHIVTHFAPAGALAKLPFGKEVLAWDQTPPSDGDLTKLALKAGETRSKNSDGLFSISDFLEKAFDETGVPIVADAFRTPSQSKDLNRGVGPVSSWLAVLKKENHLFTRFEDGFILVRHGGFWRLRKFETPEDMLAPLEAKAEKGKLTLDDYAGFVSKLTPEQTRPFRIPDSAIVRFDTHPIEAGLPALLFYASLDSRSIARAQQSGIAFDQLGSAQRQLFVDAALEGLFYGATSTSFSIQLMRLANAGDARGLGFIMRRSSDSGTGENVGGESLLFGANLNESSTYQIPSVQ